MSDHERVNILMVDDQPSKLLSYEVMLGELGENLIKAHSGREALEKLLKTEVAVVLMDVSMPELDGFELADIIRQHPRFQKTAIIFISAVHLTDLDRMKGYERGAVDYISVPVIPELLRAKVSVFAELHRKARQLETLNAELRRLSHRLITAQDEERRRIARELHDGLGQDLTAARMMLASRLQPNQDADSKESSATEAASLIDRAIQQVRTMAHLLHPLLLDEVGLIAALRWYLDGIMKRSGLETSLEVEPAEFPRLAPEVERAVFRITQEALTNVFRHSQARKSVVAVTWDMEEIRLTVRDDGKGIPEVIERLQPGSFGIGIGGMRERVKELGGNLELRNSNPGTLLLARIPVGEPLAERQQLASTPE